VSTTTPRLSLLKGDPTEVADVVVDINNAFDKLDSAAGLEPVTAFPGSPFSGKMIQRTDQGDKPYFYQATAGRFANIPFDTFFVKKSADQTVNNSIAVVNDTDLVISGLLASATYIFRAYIIYTSTTATPELKLGFTFPAGSTFSWCPAGVGLNAVSDDFTIRMPATSNVGGTRAVGTVAGIDMVAVPQGIVVTGGSSGSLQLQWAQFTATAENTIVRANSWIMVERAT